MVDLALTLEALRPAAREAGFLALAAIPCTEFSSWGASVRSRTGYGEFPSLPSLTDPTTSLPGARTIVVALWDYSRAVVPPSARSRVARLYLSESDPPDQGTHGGGRCLVEAFARLGWRWSGKVPRREAAVAAGLVVQRRNCLGYLPHGHSFLSLFAWAVDAEIQPGRLVNHDRAPAGLGEPLVGFSYPPARVDPCGRCRLCIDACPTGALASPFVLDPRRCIDRNTWRAGEWLPRELRSKMGTWIYGCDVCQEVCPRNRAVAEPAHAPGDQALLNFALEHLAMVADQEYRAVWHRYFVYNPSKNDIRRNAIVALGNLGDPAAEPILREALGDGDPMVRGHAAWALARMATRTARRTLQAALARETDPAVRDEIELSCQEAAV